jgi:predicted DNA-binding transcriptional regulator AlpA
MKNYSTLQVAAILNITSATLHRWMREKRIQAPPTQSLGGMQVRLWSEKDVEKVRKYKAKHYWKRKTPKKRDSKARANELK